MKKRESIKKSLDRVEEFQNYKLSQENYEIILDYVCNHGSCEYGMFEYARAMKKQSNFEDARYYFKHLLTSKNRKFALAELVILELNQKNYFDSLAYLKLLREEDFEYYKQKNFLNIEIYCAKELELPINVDSDEITYRDIMLIDYNPQDALNHIKLHNAEFYKKENNLSNFNIKNSHENFFASSIDIEQLFEDTRLILESEQKFQYNSDEFYDVFIDKYFVYPNIGDNTRERLNYLKVVSIVGTNNIITMFPVDSVEPNYILHNNEVYDYFECLEEVKAKKRCRQ